MIEIGVDVEINYGYFSVCQTWNCRKSSFQLKNAILDCCFWKIFILYFNSESWNEHCGTKQSWLPNI